MIILPSIWPVLLTWIPSLFMTPTQEFVVQHNENANPPTFFLTLETLIDRMQEEDKMVGIVRRETAAFSKLSCTYRSLTGVLLYIITSRQ